MKDDAEGCPICSSPNVELFLRRIGVPVHQNIVFDSLEDARRMTRGDLKLCVCERCGFIFNQAFDPSLLSYGDYDCNQMCSAFYQNHFKALSEYLVSKRGIHGKSLIEIGCGQGEFLRAVCDAGENEGLGFDPSYSGPNRVGRVRFVRGLYEANQGVPPADAAVCRQVIDHVLHPGHLFGTMRSALKDSPEARFFIETPDIEWILKNTVFWDLFYEHLSYFSARSLAAALGLAGFKIVKVRRVLEDQYLWVESAKLRPKENAPPVAAHGITMLARDYARRERALIQRWAERLRELRRRGKVAVWGAGAKGSTFLNLIDPKRKTVDCVVDLYPKKQGKFIGGAGHPIVGYQELPRRGVKTAILMNPNYRAENESLLKKAGISISLIDQSEIATQA